MLYLRDLHLCRAGLQSGILRLASLRTLALKEVSNAHAPFIERIQDLSVRRSLRDRIPDQWPQRGLDHHLVMVSLAHHAGLLPVDDVFTLLATPGAPQLSQALAQKLSEEDLDWLREKTEQAIFDFRVLTENRPVDIQDAFLRACRLGIEAHTFRPEVVLELLGIRQVGAEPEHVSAWLTEGEGMDREVVRAWIERYFLPAASTHVVPNTKPLDVAAIKAARGALALDIGASRLVDDAALDVAGFGRLGSDEDTMVGNQLDDPKQARFVAGYQILGELGRGGMGVVYRAKQPKLDREVALKVLPLDEGSDRQDVERFLREARAAARLIHPNIVSVHDVGTDGQSYYYSMDLIEGKSLAQMTKEGGLSVQRVVAIGVAVARALHAAHQEGIIHRDVKPGNILLDESGFPFLSDFGLALDHQGPTARLTVSGVTLGTPPFMPPEQVETKQGTIDARSDVYSLGATLYAGLTGKAPFSGGDILQVVRKVLTEYPTPLRQLRAAVTPDLETIVAKAMDKDPSRRYQSARDLGDELEAYLAGEPIQARPQNRILRAIRLALRQRYKTALLILVPLLLIGLSIYGIGAWESGTAYEERMEQGRAALAEEEYEAAFRLATEALEFRPGDPEAERLLQDAANRIKEQEGETQAQGARETTTKRYEDVYKVIRAFSKGLDAYERGDYAGACDGFEKCLRHDPTQVDIRFYLVSSYIQLSKKLDGAVGKDALRKALETIEPNEHLDDSPALQLMRGLLLVELGELEKGCKQLYLGLIAIREMLEVQESLGFDTWKRSFRLGDPNKYLVMLFETQLIEMITLERGDSVRTEGMATDPDRVAAELVQFSDGYFEWVEEVIDKQFNYRDLRKKSREILTGRPSKNQEGLIDQIFARRPLDSFRDFCLEFLKFYALVGAGEDAKSCVLAYQFLYAQDRDSQSLIKSALADIVLQSGEENRFEEARDLYKEAMKGLPDESSIQHRYLWLLLQEAGSQRRHGSKVAGYTKALSEIKKAFKARPKDDTLHFLAGVASYHLGHFGTSLETFDILIGRKTDPSLRRANLYVYRAATIKAMNEGELTEKAWRGARRFDPTAFYIRDWLQDRTLRVFYAGRVYEGIKVKKTNFAQMEYSEKSEEWDVKAARLMPIFYYRREKTPEDRKHYWLATIRLADLSKRLGQERWVRFAKNLIDAGFDEADEERREFCKALVRYLEGWTHEEMERVTWKPKHPEYEIAIYMLALGHELETKVAKENHAGRARELNVAIGYYSEMSKKARKYSFVGRWSREVLEKLGR